MLLDNLEEGQWFVRARANYGNQSTEWSEAVSFSTLTTDVALVDDFEFRLNNPYFSSADKLHIQFSLSQPSKIKFYITSLTGKKLKMVNEGMLNTGQHELRMSVPGLLPGLYLLTLESNAGIKTVKLVKPY